MRRCFDMQIWAALPNRRRVGIGIDLVSTLRQAIEQGKADQAVSVRLMIGQAFGGAVDEDIQWLCRLIHSCSMILGDPAPRIAIAWPLFRRNGFSATR